MSVVRKCQRKGKPSVKRQKVRAQKELYQFANGKSVDVAGYGAMLSNGAKEIQWKTNAHCV